MVKRILIPLNASPFTDAAVEFACYLAKRHRGEVAGLVVLDVPGIEKSIGAVPVGGLYYAELRITGEEKRAEARIHALLEKFKRQCDAAGVAHVECERQGAPSKHILIESNYFDCLVLGLRTYFDYRTDAGDDNVYGTSDDHVGSSLAELMDDSAIPMFAVPIGWSQPSRNMNVVIAFDGSVPAVRTLHQNSVLLRKTQLNVSAFLDQMEKGSFLSAPGVQRLFVGVNAPTRD